MTGIRADAGMAVAEDLQARQSYRRGHPIAIDPQVVERGVTLHGQVHLDALQQVFEVALRDGIALDGVPQGARDEACRLAVVAVLQLVAPGP